MFLGYLMGALFSQLSDIFGFPSPYLFLVIGPSCPCRFIFPRNFLYIGTGIKKDRPPNMIGTNKRRTNTVF